MNIIESLEGIATALADAGVNDAAYHLRAIIAALSRPSTGKLREMSCPTCCAVRSVVEVRSMMCTTCRNEFQTPEQLDAALAGEKESPRESK